MNKVFLEFIKVFYTENELKQTEFWIGKYNLNSNFTTLLCSKNKGESIFNNYITSSSDLRYIENITGTFEIDYADGNLEKIADTLNATSSIPGFKPPIKINDTFYVDGGVSSPSPGSTFTNVLLKYGAAQLAADNTEKFHFIYTIGEKYIDKDIERIKPLSHWSMQMYMTLKSLLNCSKIRERQLMLNTWAHIIGETSFDNIQFTTIKGKKDLKTFLTANNNKHIFITCYSKGDSCDILNFTKEDLKRLYKDCYDKSFFEIFYV